MSLTDYDKITMAFNNKHSMVISATKFIEKSQPQMGEIEMPTRRELVDSIARAIKHARSVAKREHKKADRHERVGIFVTSLRSTFISRCRDYYVGKLCEKRLWYDIGELNEPVQLPAVSYKGAQYEPQGEIRVTTMNLKSWVYEANLQTGERNLAEEIDEDLAELEKSLPGFKVPIEQATHLNEQADQVLNSLIDIFKTE